MGYRFPSREWAERFCEKLNENPRYRASARGWKWPILFKVAEEGASPGFILNLSEGRCLGVEWLDDASKGDAPFIISTSLENWLEIIQGRITPIAAFTRRKLRLEKGSIQTILRYPAASMEMVKSAQEVPIDLEK